MNSTPWLQDILGSYADWQIRYLSDANIQDLCTRDVTEAQFSSRQGVAGVERALLTILPTANLVKYQHALSDYMGDLWHGEAPEKRGAAYKTKLGCTGSTIFMVDVCTFNMFMTRPKKREEDQKLWQLSP